MQNLMDRAYAISQHVHTPYSDDMPAMVLNAFASRLSKDIQEKKKQEQMNANRSKPTIRSR